MDTTFRVCFHCNKLTGTIIINSFFYPCYTSSCYGSIYSTSIVITPISFKISNCNRRTCTCLHRTYRYTICFRINFGICTITIRENLIQLICKLMIISCTGCNI